MSKMFALLAAAVLFSGLTLVAQAQDEKKVTITGEGQCAKCSLGETKSCQNVVVVEEDGEEVKYYLVHEGKSKEFHKNICQETKTVKATGTVEEKDGKKIMKVTAIEVVEE